MAAITKVFSIDKARAATQAAQKSQTKTQPGRTMPPRRHPIQPRPYQDAALGVRELAQRRTLTLLPRGSGKTRRA